MTDNPRLKGTLRATADGHENPRLQGKLIDERRAAEHAGSAAVGASRLRGTLARKEVAATTELPTFTALRPEPNKVKIYRQVTSICAYHQPLIIKTA